MSRFKLLLIVSVAYLIPLFLYSGELRAETNVQGIINENTTWRVSDSPIIVVGSVLVPSGVTLTIEPGVVVKFDNAKGLQIEGQLIARGTNARKIRFTSNATTQAPGDWASIFFTDSSVDATLDSNANYVSGSILENCIVEYAGSGESLGAIYASHANPFLNQCLIQNNNIGVRISSPANSSESFKITNSTIRDNLGRGLMIAGSIAEISNNTIVNNRGGIFLGGKCIVNIHHNIVSENYGDDGAGINAINANGGALTISNNVITHNSGGHHSGGGGIATSTKTVLRP